MANGGIPIPSELLDSSLLNSGLLREWLESRGRGRRGNNLDIITDLILKDHVRDLESLGRLSSQIGSETRSKHG